MVGIDFVDTIVVRRVADKGTKIIEEKLEGSNWAGESFKKYEKERRQLARGLSIASAKGTLKIPLHKLVETQIPDTSGLLMSAARGTGLRMG